MARKTFSSLITPFQPIVLENQTIDSRDAANAVVRRGIAPWPQALYGPSCRIVGHGVGHTAFGFPGDNGDEVSAVTIGMEQVGRFTRVPEWTSKGL